MLSDPYLVLRMARSASDPRIAGEAHFHGAPVTIVAFHDHAVPVSLWIADDNHLPVAAEALITAPEDAAWSSRGDLLDRVEWMNWNWVEGARFPFQWDRTRNGRAMETVSVLDARLNVPLDEQRLTVDPAQAVW